MNVAIVDYDPQWVLDFEALRARIWPTVQDFAHSMEHVGSTSVPGLAAKPVLDIDVIVRDQDGVQLAIERLSAIGYSYRGNLGIEGREAFRAAVNEPAHNLYVCREDCDALRDHLMFRDYLSGHPETARAYADLKRALASQFPDDIDRYAMSKTDFVTGILRAAGTSQARIDHIRRENGFNPPNQRSLQSSTMKR
jgi:GrpB-like predicted nucleotidyltransferase (UPF0157 family)